MAETEELKVGDSLLARGIVVQTTVGAGRFVVDDSR